MFVKLTSEGRTVRGLHFPGRNHVRPGNGPNTGRKPEPMAMRTILKPRCVGEWLSGVHSPSSILSSRIRA